MKANWSSVSYISAFLTGVILFWSLGRDWLDLKSASVFLAGMIGAAVSVLLFAAWNMFHHSSHKDN